MSKAKRENRRYDHKRERQAVQASLRGDHARQPLTSNWGHRPEASLLVDDSHQTTGIPAAKKRKNCKHKKGGRHNLVANPGYKPDRWWSHSPYICADCGHKAYSLPDDDPRQLFKRPPDHWATVNILARLSGIPCGCSYCVDKRTQK